MASDSNIRSSTKMIAEHGVVTKRTFSITTKLCFILGFLSFLLYANTLQNGYVMDDGLVITKNKLVGQGIKAIPELLTTSHLKGHGNIAENTYRPLDTYRPLSLVMFAIEKELFGYDPTAGHLFNILAYIGCVIMLFLFFDKLFERKKTAAAFIAALLFAIHPIHTEVVANIKSRDELLCFFFAFWSLNVFTGYMDTGKAIKLLGGASLLFLSFISKETAVTFIAVIPLIFFFYRNEHKKRSIYITVSTVAVAVIFIAIRASVLKGFYLSGGNSAIDFLDNQLADVPATASRIATEILALGYYIKLLFVPWPLLCNHSYNTIPFVGFNNAWALLSLILYTFLAILGIYRLVKVKKDPWAFGILFFLATLSLFSNIPFLVGEIFAERFAFFASAGFCLLIALAMERWLANGKNAAGENKGVFTLFNRKVLFLLVPVLLLFGSMTIARNKDWQSNYTLFTTDAKNAPGNSRLLSYAGNELITRLKDKSLTREEKSQIAEDAITDMQNSLAVYPGNAEAHAGLMKLFLMEKMLDSALAHEQLAVALAPGNIDILNNAAAFFFHTQQYRQALLLYQKNQQTDAGDVGDYGNIGLCYYYLHEYDSSIANLKKALEVIPENKEPYAQLALVYNAMGKMDSALKYAEIVRQYRPDFKLPQQSLGK
jgi:protein O-mannosyl-transferase